MKKISGKIILLSLIFIIFVPFFLRYPFRMAFGNAFNVEDIRSVDTNIFFFGTLLAGAMVVTSLNIAIQYIVVRRLNRLNEATKTIANGNFSINIIDNGKDEIARLTKSFNFMADELKANEYLSKDFVRNISHEIRTPISSIKGYAELIYQDNNSKSEIKEYAKVIIKESQRLTDLSKNILHLSLLESTTIIKNEDYYSITEQIRNVIQTMQVIWEEKGISFDLELEEIIIKSNKGFTYQIWQNLISNAIKFSLKDGIVEIKLKNEDDKIIFSIKNSGTIITDDQKQYIFNLFYVADKSRNEQGNGLGLVITKRIVKKLNGFIDYESDEFSGTKFSIVIPIASEF